ncbi:MAG: Gfo/Idh/MocA family oxidoreductase [Opitutales bacterium]|jgi:predicted dehydrogenase|nr:Gfo/Idh/MocA family oxidoreductase [Opitutales bacterium]MDP4643413.1 Gfo/Idh/MocA family oxidoreductase [Opitutales bacterium]MDP4694132.1 Gfo/Idh/MocA family oxidoreductase [Opitutales bacterium]MDP4777779.1 Gfo/Idh/MocA family oxidoreductase [Opitutales bacterium]MDP4883999.1 Gfo/Idh/MocA family oxidoreductase [Opitutales bacterium]
MKNPIPHVTRRTFLKSSAAFGALTVLPSYVVLGNKSSTGIAPSERINLAAIGVGNRGGGVLKTMYDTGLCNVVALCDIDMGGAHTHENRYRFGLTDKAPATKKGVTVDRAPYKARGFTDFRKMLEEMGDEIDAVLVGTPDHSHFAACMLAMSLGKHVYVEKPLAHTFGQAARMMDLAERSGVATQMGNQGHSGGNYFQFKAWTEAGIIKDVTRIKAYMNRSRRWHGWGQDTTEFPVDPMPDYIDWDQWHATVVTKAPFSKRLHPAEWRSWFDFGSGAFGDWGPHILDTCHEFLQLGLPHTISADLLQGPNKFVFPQASTIRFDFAERGPGLPACNVTWQDGIDNTPVLEEEYFNQEKNKLTGKTELVAPKLNTHGKIIYSKDFVFQGGSHSEVLTILPKEKYLDVRRTLPTFSQKNSDHYTNFLLSCKGEETTRSPFSVSGPLCQVFNLGVIAQRLGGELKFDAKSQTITNNKAAQALLDPAPRKGWEEFYKM